MISQEIIQKLATQYQTSELNVVREYFQHLFLSQLYKEEGAENVIFKGGTALRIIYGSPRFSEDLDFSIFNIEKGQQEKIIEDVFIKVLVAIKNVGIEVKLGPKPGRTSDGYYGDAEFQLYDHQPVAVAINISSRNGRKMSGEVDSIANDFVPTYNLFHLPQTELVEEKIFDALIKRKKPRDFYDLYFIMRKNMLSPDQKARLNQRKEEIIGWANKINFNSELSVFLPQSQQDIVRDFAKNLGNELNRQLSGI